MAKQSPPSSPSCRARAFRRGAARARTPSLRAIPALAVLSFPALASAASDRSLKALVFEDCDRAVAGFEALQTRDRGEFIAYLAKVATMQSHPLAESLFDPGAKSPVPAPIPGNIDGPQDFDPLRAFEPSRELDAKRCALRILALSAPDSFTMLPEVVPLVNDPTLPEELRDLVAYRVWEAIRTTVKNGEFTPPRAAVDRLVAQATDDHGWLAANAVVELRGRAVPSIIEQLGRATPQQRDRLLALLTRIDGGEGIVVEPLAKLLDSADDDLRTRAAHALARLPGSRAQIVYELARKLVVPLPEVRSVCFESLKEIQGRTAVDERRLTTEQALTLLEVLPSLVPAQQATLTALLVPLLPPTAEVISRLIQLSTAPNTPLQAPATELLGPLSANDPEAKKRILDALFDSSVEVRKAALQAYPTLSIPESEQWSQILRVLKRLADVKDAAAREQLLAEVVNTIERAPASKEADRTIPYLIEALAIRERTAGSNGEKEPIDSAAAKYLVSLGPPAVPSLIKALRKSDPLVRARATWALGKSSTKDRDVVSSIFSMMKDPAPEVQAAAEEALVRIGAPARKLLEEQLRKLTGSKPPAISPALSPADALLRDAIARTLFRLGDSTDRVRELASTSPARMGCQGSADFLGREVYPPPPAPAPAATAEPAPVRVDPLRPYFGRAVIDCMLNEPVLAEQSLKVLIDAAPLSEDALVRLREILAKESLRPDLLLALAPFAKDLGLRAADVVPLLEKMIASSENAVRYRVIGMLNKWGGEAASAAKTLEPLLDQAKADPVLQCRIAATLAVIAPDAFDYSSFFADELDDDAYQAALTALAEIGPERGVPVLLRAFDSVDPHRKIPIVAALGRFDSGAAQALDSLLALSRSGDPLLRSTVAIAVMRIAPDDERSKAAFRRELLGRYGNKLAGERYPVTSVPALESVLSASESWVERRLLEEALGKSREQQPIRVA